MSSPNDSLRPEPPADAAKAAPTPPHGPIQGHRGQAQEHRLSLCNDVVFKALFSRHPQLLSDLINAVRHPAAPIKVQRILNPNILPQDLAGKEIMLDILAEDDSGQRFAIEMQLRRYLHWPQRSVYGVARGLSGQLEAGQNYRHLQPVIGINLLAHNLFTDYPDKALWHFTLRDAECAQVQLGSALQMHIIELPKAEALGKLPAPLSAWIACLLHNLDEAAMNEITHPPVKEALAHLETMYSDEELRLMAERREQALVDTEDMLDYARFEKAQQILISQLEHKFGPLPKHYRSRLPQATDDQLQRWSLNVLDAQRIEDVFV